MTIKNNQTKSSNRENTKNYLSLNVKLALLTGILMLSIAGIISATLWVTAAQKADGLVINLAGRQRMLTQKFTKEFYDALTIGQENNVDAPFLKTARLFETTLQALHKGGVTYLDLGMTIETDVPATTDQAIGDVLTKFDSLCQQFQPLEQ